MMELLKLPTFLQGTTINGSKPTVTNITKLKNPLTYPKSAEPFDKHLFEHPTSEYRGCPLWSWNTKLDWQQMKRQIDCFETMGLGGFYMHVRVGLDTEYMGDEFMEAVSKCVDYAASKGMMACLYDDDRWPSGVAGGKVTKQYPEHRGKHVLFTPSPYGTVPELGGERSPTSGRACRSENGTLLATYDVKLDENGHLISADILSEGETGENTWYAYLETNPGSPWFNDQTYVDTLSKSAISRFIESTHEVYKAKIGGSFGSTVPSIFTDEPQFAILTQLSNPRAREDIFIPWSGDIEETFRKDYSSDLLKILPEIVWNLPAGKASLARYQFHDHVCERFVSAFMDQIAAWCKNNGIILNGHMMEEPTLQSQSTAVGEIMRCYRNMDMPGIDMLCDWVEYNTAKQCSSVARQNGVRGVMSELYGVTHWWFTFEGHKGADWQAALGVTFRVQHLAWLSMAGESKRDYPASINYQSAWHQEYSYVEDHFARVAVTLTRGHAVTNVGVIHPIESYWLAFGPNGSGDEMNVRNQAFADLTEWLLHASIDFDFVSESLLPSQIGKSKSKDKKLHVGACKYDVIIVPNLSTIRSSTLKILQTFSKAGGKVVIAGNGPSLVDAKVPKTLPTIEKSVSVLWSKQNILHSLEDYREIKITTNNREPTQRLLHQIRQDEKERFVFICNEDRNNPIDTIVKLKGEWQLTELETLTGSSRSLSSTVDKGWTALQHRFEGCASLLLRLTPAKDRRSSSAVEKPSIVEDVPASLSLKDVSLSEPNVLILDFASYQYTKRTEPTHTTDWSPFTEVLRLENEIRTQLQIPLKGEAFKQPWAVSPEERSPIANLQLRFKFWSDYDIKTPVFLALEDPALCDIRLNYIPVPNTPVNNYEVQVGDVLNSNGTNKDWWVDESIKVLSIPASTIKKGENLLVVNRTFGLLTNIERIYILGSFGVMFEDARPTLYETDLTKISWGDHTKQGLPFYAGNVTYHCSVSVEELEEEYLNDDSAATHHLTAVSRRRHSHQQQNNNDLTIHIPHFSAPLLKLHSSTTPLGRIAFQPRTLSFRYSPDSAIPNSMQLNITAFGNRYNAFGHLHLPLGMTNLCGPGLYRTGGDLWTDGYAIMEMGVLEEPVVSCVACSEASIGDNNQGNDARGSAGGIVNEKEDWVLV